MYARNRRDRFFGGTHARAGVSMNETFEVRFQPLFPATPNVKALPTELWNGGEISNDYPAQGNSYILVAHTLGKIAT